MTIAAAEFNQVFPCSSLPEGAAASLLARYGLQLVELPLTAEIPGSYWGTPEAGIIGCTVYIRPDTPVHSLLHESCHVICMDQQRRETLHTDAGGEIPEENAVCYLQILLATQLPEFGRERALLDMDRWGYTFRLGSARNWFEQDAADACHWLQQQGLIDPQQQPIYQLRT
ncbi:MAG: hypothetical protein R3E95_05695 [Thiolinea sp.]